MLQLSCYHLTACDSSVQSDIILLVDASGSSDTQLAFIRQSKTIINNMDPASGRTRIAMVTFALQSRDTHVRYDFDTYRTKGELREATNFYEPASRTSMSEGLRVAKDLFDRLGRRRNRQRVIVIMTDGAPDIVSDDTLEQAADLRNDDITIHAIGYDRVRQKQLEGLASSLPVRSGKGPLSTFPSPYIHLLTEGAGNRELIGDIITNALCDHDIP